MIQIVKESSYLLDNSLISFNFPANIVVITAKFLTLWQTISFKIDFHDYNWLWLKYYTVRLLKLWYWKATITQYFVYLMC